MPRLKKAAPPRGEQSPISPDIQETRDIAEEVKELSEQDIPDTVPYTDKDLVSSACTILNLRCSGHSEGAFRLGTMVNIVGDSHVGKSILALSILAECAHDKRFDKYALVYDDTENASFFDIGTMFGKELAKRLTVNQSRYFEDWQSNMESYFKTDTPVIYVLDSFDGMKTIDYEKLQDENMKRREKGQEEKGSFGDGKAKLMSGYGGRLNDGLAKTASLCVIISQTRQNIGFSAMFNPKIRSGGDALKFYAAHEVWLSVKQTEKHSKYKNEVVRTQVQAKVNKNKLTGRRGVAEFVVLEGYGIDDISSCIKYLCDFGTWSGTASSIDTKGFIDTGSISRSKLVQYIEENEKEDELYKLCQQSYDSLIQEISPDRKRRYA